MRLPEILDHADEGIREECGDEERIFASLGWPLTLPLPQGDFESIAMPSRGRGDSLWGCAEVAERAWVMELAESCAAWVAWVRGKHGACLMNRGIEWYAGDCSGARGHADLGLWEFRGRVGDALVVGRFGEGGCGTWEGLCRQRHPTYGWRARPGLVWRIVKFVSGRWSAGVVESEVDRCFDVDSVLTRYRNCLRLSPLRYGSALQKGLRGMWK